MKIELSQNKVASTSKLRREFEKRTAANAEAATILHNNQHLWQSVGGPSPDALFRPSATDLEKAQQCCEVLARMKEVDDRDGISEFADEIAKAVGMLKSVEWESIRKDKFSLTPAALFTDLVRTAESLISRQAAEIIRRQAWLSAEVEPEVDRAVPIAASTADKYGVDLEEFKMKSGKKPKKWKEAVKIAEWRFQDAQGCAFQSSSRPLLCKLYVPILTFHIGYTSTRCERFWNYITTPCTWSAGKVMKARLQ